MWKNHHSPSIGSNEGSVASASEHIEHRGSYQSPQSRKPYGGTSLGFKPVCQDFPEFNHCLLIISFGKIHRSPTGG
jgi:hypothetical protein